MNNKNICVICPQNMEWFLTDNEMLLKMKGSRRSRIWRASALFSTSGRGVCPYLVHGFGLWRSLELEYAAVILSSKTWVQRAHNISLASGSPVCTTSMSLTVVSSRRRQKALSHITEEREAGNIWLSDFEVCLGVGVVNSCSPLSY